MENETNKSRLERQLAAKEEQIKLRIDDLGSEIASTPAAIKSAIRKNPWVGVGAAVAVGAVVGLIFGGLKRKSSVQPAHQNLVEGYIDAVADEVRKGIRRGKDPEEVVRKSLRGRAPVILYAPEKREREEESSRGFLRQVGDLTLKTALGFAVKTAIDFFTASLDLKELQKMMVLEEEERRSGAERASPPSGDGASQTPSVENGAVEH